MTGLARLLAVAFLGLVGLIACAPGPNTPDPMPAYDARAIARCDHGIADGQQDFRMEPWRACLEVARFLTGEPSAQLKYARMSCDLGYDEGCIAYLDFVHAIATRHDAAADAHIAEARAMGTQFCEKGLKDFEWRELRTGEACHLAALLFQDVKPMDATVTAHLFELGCKRNDEASCKWVQAHGAGVGSAAGGGE